MQMTHQKGAFIFVRITLPQELTVITQQEYANMFVTFQHFTLLITL